MSLMNASNRRSFRGIAAVLLGMFFLQACASAAPATPASGGVPANVPCNNAEYQDLVSKAGEQPLSEAEQRRMEQLYAECVRQAQVAAMPQQSGGGAGGLLKALLWIGIIVGALYYLDSEGVFDEDYFKPIGQGVGDSLELVGAGGPLPV